MNGEFLIPIILFGATAWVFIVYFNNRSKERMAMIEKIIANRQSPTLAASLDGGHVYFSMDGPIAVGRQLTKDEILGLARFIRVIGSDKVLERLDSNGRVIEVQLLKGLGHGLDEAAIEAARRFAFKPAAVDGNPVRTEINFTYRFRLED
mgnify:CR=1 FL=1